MLSIRDWLAKRRWDKMEKSALSEIREETKKLISIEQATIEKLLRPKK